MVPRMIPGADGLPAPAGPHRMWSPAIGWHGPSLAMSHKEDKVAPDMGVIADPLVGSQSLLSQSKMWLVFASDGVSNALGTRGMARALGGAETAEQGVSSLMCAAERKSMRADDEPCVGGGAGEDVDPASVRYIDGISAVVLRLINAN